MRSRKWTSITVITLVMVSLFVSPFIASLMHALAFGLLVAHGYMAMHSSE
ncbi:hypothetical protein [Thaumasiovibrio subtropicus]|nr:hypothetical protein [Thaumasiovibrio subtropicus]